MEPTHDSVRARLVRLCHPGYSFCLRCGMPWRLVAGHCTPYGPNVVEHFRSLDANTRELVETGCVSLGTRGCFPLCNGCWTQLTIEEREPYYWTLLREWDQGPQPVSEDVIHQVISACREGL